MFMNKVPRSTGPLAHVFSITIHYVFKLINIFLFSVPMIDLQTFEENMSQTHVLVYPFTGSGHIIPLLDLTDLLLRRGLTITVVISPVNLPLLDPLLSSHPSSLHKFPAPDPEIDPSSPHPLIGKVISTQKQFDPIVKWFRSHPSPPVAIVSDFFLGWTNELASHLGIRRVVFNPSGVLGSSIIQTMWRDAAEIYADDGDKDENSLFSFPEIPKSPEFAMWQLPPVSKYFKKGDPDYEAFRSGMLANMKSWGVVYNTFEELEKIYIDHMKKLMGHDRVWAVGPLLPDEQGPGRGGSSTVPSSDLLTWLDNKPDDSVVYICFGSRTTLTEKQMDALTGALEISSVNFILCTKESDSGFEERVGDRGFIVKGWAPQLAVLRHQAVASFVTHCGWNSTLEGITSGVMMLTWPMGADQYADEKLLVDELGVGKRVCEGRSDSVPDSVELARLLDESLSGYIAERVKVKEMSQAAKKAVKEGSSIRDLNTFMELLHTNIIYQTIRRLSMCDSTTTTTATHLLVYPINGSGHIIPLLDLTHLLLRRGLTITIIISPSNLPLLDPLIPLYPSTLHKLVFSDADHRPSPHPLIAKILATQQLFDPIVEWFQSHPSPPVAIISDFFLGWTNELATHLGIKRVVFSPSGALGSSVFHMLWQNQSEINALNVHGDESFLVSLPEIPNSPEFPWRQFSTLWRDYKEGDSDYESFRKGILGNLTSWGIIYNTFEKLEGVYIDHMKKQIGHDRVWAIGPLLPDEDTPVATTARGGSSAVPPDNLLMRLDKKPDDSVVYICFGSRGTLSENQMTSLASALEISNVDFILCLKEADSCFLPSGFQDRVNGRGFVVKGWVPQLVILRHRAVGSFVSHCGWNSTIEGVVSGVTMLTWPLGADQYANEKLLVDELGVGKRVWSVPDAVELARLLDESLSCVRPERVRIKELSESAIEAVKEGTSTRDIDMFIQQISELKDH
ncbi:hypothetical protein LXL04_030557 [Taraxacum kok-saghyz]